MKEETTTIDPTWMAKTGGYARDMTMRDYFAGLAMQGLIANGSIALYDRDFYSNRAYDMADEMLKARNK
jgi:hypothetical protein